MSLVFNVVFRMLLVISIVLQSITAVSSENHQIDANHLQTQHDHASDFDTSNQNASDDHEVNDCHHCGHCNGGHLTWITVKNTSKVAHQADFVSTPYPVGITERYLADIHRPPIT